LLWRKQQCIELRIAVDEGRSDLDRD